MSEPLHLTDPQLAMLAARAQGWECDLYKDRAEYVACRYKDGLQQWNTYDPANRWADAGPLLGKMWDGRNQTAIRLGKGLSGIWITPPLSHMPATAVKGNNHCRAITIAFIQVEAERQGVKWEEWL